LTTGERSNRVDGELIALSAQTADHALGGMRHIGVMPERLPRVGIGQMHFDYGHVDRLDRVVKCNRGMGIGPSIQDHTAGLLARFDQPVDQFASLQDLVKDLDDGAVDLLLILGGNPAFTAPVELGMRDRLKKAKLRVRLGPRDVVTVRLAPGAEGTVMNLEPIPQDTSIN